MCLRTFPEGSSKDVLRTSTKICPWKVDSRRPWDVKSKHPWDVRLGRPRNGQKGCLEDVLGTLEGDVLGTSWRLIFAGWELTSKI